MKILVAIPTLSRADLLVRNRTFLESIRPPDRAVVIDNGNQGLDFGTVPIYTPFRNLGVSGSWNWALRTAFVDDAFDLLILLQDDIIWSSERLEAARRLSVEVADVDLFLSFHQFSVQMHRLANLRTIGLYDERYTPAYAEDDDYALTVIQRGRVYERFRELDPLPGSITEGTPKPIPWKTQNGKLIAKWGFDFGINDVTKPYYKTNRNFRLTFPDSSI